MIEMALLATVSLAAVGTVFGLVLAAGALICIDGGQGYRFFAGLAKVTIVSAAVFWMISIYLDSLL